MDNVVTVYHGGTLEEDEFENISFVGMRRVPLLFDDRPLLSELFGRAREELHCNSNEDAISVEGILHFGKSGRIFRRLVPIASEGEWEKYVKTVMKNEFQCLDLVVRRLSNDPTPHGYSPPNGHPPLSGFSPEPENPAPSDHPLANREVEVEDVVVLRDAQSAPNEVGICHDAQSATAGRRIFHELGRVAIESSGSGGGGGKAKRQRVDELDDRCEAVSLDAVPVDLISALPDELRLRVLTQLPLKDTIRMGALARGWRDLWRRRWAHRANLEVHIHSHYDAQRELETLVRVPHPHRRLERFSLIVGMSRFKGLELRRFLDYAAECGVEDLHVQATGDTVKFHFPLSCPNLACLSLRFIGFPTMCFKGARPYLALVVIRLVSVSCTREAFKNLMALCPNLLTLDLRSCCCYGWEFDRLPPNLRSLTIANCGRITNLDFVLVPTLRSFRYKGHFSNLPLSIPRDAVLSDLYIQLDESASMEKWVNEWNIDKLRESLPKDLSSLNVLTICDRALTGASVLSADGDSARLPKFKLHSLKELHLLMFEMKAVNLSNLYLFLKTFQCPSLERLFVQLPAYGLRPMKDSIDEVREEPPEDGLHKLVTVNVKNFNWCPTEVQLVSFLLRKASSLQKLLLVSDNITKVDFRGAPEADILLLKEALVNGKIMLTTSDNAASQPYHDAYIQSL